MIPISKPRLLSLNLAALAVCALMALAWWLGFGRVPTVTPAEARALLDDPQTPAVLVDVRPVSAFMADHLPGAVNWPCDQIHAAKGLEAMPVQLGKRRLLLVCDTGLRSATAARKLTALGVADVWCVQGGLVNWALAASDPDGAQSRPGTATASSISSAAFRPMPVSKQWVVVITAFGVKPVYLLVSFVMIVTLWRRRSPDLVALRWGLIWFWAGEQACTANYLAYGGRSDPLEYLHNFGMVAGFAFVAWAAMEGLDQRLIRFSAAKDRCAALSLCRRCIKYADEPCGLRRLFLFGIPATAVLALLPLTADFKLAAYRSDILGATVCYSHTLASQLFEIRFCPVLALGLFTASWLVLRLKREDPVPLSKLLFAVGLGPLGFSLLRLALVAIFSDDLMWFESWEEWTELLFVVGVACVLWIFRHGLFPHSATSTEPNRGTPATATD